MTTTKERIGLKVTRMVGYNIVGLSDILSILTHPDVLPLVKELIEEVEE